MSSGFDDWYDRNIRKENAEVIVRDDLGKLKPRPSMIISRLAELRQLNTELRHTNKNLEQECMELQARLDDLEYLMRALDAVSNVNSI